MTQFFQVLLNFGFNLNNTNYMTSITDLDNLIEN